MTCFEKGFDAGWNAYQAYLQHRDQPVVLTGLRWWSYLALRALWWGMASIITILCAGLWIVGMSLILAGVLNGASADDLWAARSLFLQIFMVAAMCTVLAWLLLHTPRTKRGQAS
jgi:hypothetical protein